jgi:hypothetical protein
MRQYAPGGAGDFELELAEASSARRLLEVLGVPADQKPFVAVNGRKVEMTYLLCNGDEVVLFDQMEGG